MINQEGRGKAEGNVLPGVSCTGIGFAKRRAHLFASADGPLWLLVSDRDSWSESFVGCKLTPLFEQISELDAEIVFGRIIQSWCLWSETTSPNPLLIAVFALE